MVCYESRKLKDHERNYVVHDLELETVVHALKMWHHYLLGKKFLLLIDNTYVKHLFTHPGLNARQERWMAFLSEFDFEVKHIKGKENKVADALNRRTYKVYEITMSQPEDDMLGRIKIVGIHDAEYGNLLNKLWTEEVNLNGTEFRVDQKGIIWFKRTIYMPNVADLKLFILNEMYKPRYARHPGYQKMITHKAILFPQFEDRYS